MIIGRIRAALAWAGAALLTLAAAFLYGQQVARQRAALRAAERRADTIERVRDLERESNAQDDTSLADRISRRD